MFKPYLIDRLNHLLVVIVKFQVVVIVAGLIVQIDMIKGVKKLKVGSRLREIIVDADHETGLL